MGATVAIIAGAAAVRFAPLSFRREALLVTAAGCAIWVGLLFEFARWLLVGRRYSLRVSDRSVVETVGDTQIELKWSNIEEVAPSRHGLVVRDRDGQMITIPARLERFDELKRSLLQRRPI
ncbi:MAG: YcxB family protein [Deltaproteobacteria bacterium]|nr:YcxB family protein [Deltaproteobacteria bacterium]